MARSPSLSATGGPRAFRPWRKAAAAASHPDRRGDDGTHDAECVGDCARDFSRCPPPYLPIPAAPPTTPHEPRADPTLALEMPRCSPLMMTVAHMLGLDVSGVPFALSELEGTRGQLPQPFAYPGTGTRSVVYPARARGSQRKARHRHRCAHMRAGAVPWIAQAQLCEWVLRASVVTVARAFSRCCCARPTKARPQTPARLGCSSPDRCCMHLTKAKALLHALAHSTSCFKDAAASGRYHWITDGILGLIKLTARRGIIIRVREVTSPLPRR
jgi:hypothetical protein